MSSLAQVQLEPAGPLAVEVKLGSQPLAALTTLGLGGPAEALIEVDREVDLAPLLADAKRQGQPVNIVGGGSNVVIADDGVAGLVLRVGWRGLTVRSARRTAGAAADRIEVTAAAGEPWDAFVAWTVAQGWAGLECLSGIPGTVGATPIQNVGAYGQEVAETIVSVRLLDRQNGEVVDAPAEELGFGYRTSVLRREPGRAVVMAVTFALRPGGVPTLRYGELAAALGVSQPAGAMPMLDEVRSAVRALRRGKGMLHDPATPPEERLGSVGSFFVNPVLALEQIDHIARVARAAGQLAHDQPVPAFRAAVAGATSSVPDEGGRPFKVPAAWLIERAGFTRGTRRGAVGISPHHALALVHHGGGSTNELLALAVEIQQAVLARFAVHLEPEPVWLGQDPPPAPFARRGPP